MPLGEMLNLEQLSETCKRLNRWTFFFTSCPANCVGELLTILHAWSKEQSDKNKSLEAAANQQLRRYSEPRQRDGFLLRALGRLTQCVGRECSDLC